MKKEQEVSFNTFYSFNIKNIYIYLNKYAYFYFYFCFYFFVNHLKSLLL